MTARMIKHDAGEYSACLTDHSVTAADAADLATAYRAMATWHKRESNLAMVAWWQSVSDVKATRSEGLSWTP